MRKNKLEIMNNPTAEEFRSFIENLDYIISVIKDGDMVYIIYSEEEQ